MTGLVPRLLFFVCILCTQIEAQVKFDVKTSFVEKKKLKVVKAGLIAYLNQSEWASVQEIGESYSVWLVNFKRSIKKNLVKWELDLELRKPAMITHGELISSRHVADSIDFEGASSGRNVEEEEMQEMVKRQLENMKSVKNFLPMVAAVLPGVSVLSVPFIQRFLGTFTEQMEQEPYTVNQAVEGMIVGARLLSVLKGMMDATQRGKE
jgi:hypothetical protein